MAHKIAEPPEPKEPQEPQMPTEPAAVRLPPPVANFELKAMLLLLLMMTLVIGSIVYVMYARGVFERTQQLTLLAPDSEGVTVGTDLTFSGFPVGRVRRIELGAEGKVHIIVDLAQKDAKWVRDTSVFTMERGVVGGTSLKVYTGDLSAPPLAKNAIRPVLFGDATAKLPGLLSSVQLVADNLERMTRDDSSVNLALANVQTISSKMHGRYGLLGSVMGSDDHAKKIMQALDGVNQTLGGVNQTLGGVNKLVANADTQVFGKKGVMVDAQATVQQLNGLLSEVRGSLKKVDAVLVEAQTVGSNLRTTTTDLGPLRDEVEQSLRKVQHLVNEINRKWPLARDTELKLP